MADDTLVDAAQESGAVQAVHAPIPDYGLGLAGFETEDDDVTPTQSRLRISKGLKEIVPEGVANPLDRIPNREWDTNMMRNVTVRRKRAQPPNPVNTNVEPLSVSRDLKHSPRAAETKEKHSPRTPSTTSSPKDLGWSPLRQNMTSHLRNSSDPRRASTLSTSSTIVEAVVIATPPQRQRTLRHVSKKVILRDSSSSSESSPTSTVNAATFSPQDAPQRILHHKQVVARTSQVRRKSPTPAVALKHHRESLSLRSDAAKSAKRPRGSKLQPINGEAVDSDSKPESQPLQPAVSTETQSTIRSAVDRSVSDAIPPRVKFTDSTNALADQKEKNDISSTSLTRSATQKALKAVIPMASTHREETKQPDIADAQPAAEPAVVAVNPSTPAEHTTKKSSVARSYSGSSSLSPSKPFSARRLSLDDTTTEDIRRYSFDRSTIGTYEYARNSLDRSNSRIEEHAMARHLYSQVTPFSQISDVPSQLEVSEAKAVNIYPHNNNSLLVVQHGGASARPAQTQLIRRNTTSSTSAASPASELEPPLLTFQPSTPPPKEHPSAQSNVDSPLKNPRPPPEPPAIKILPATPFEELDSSPIDVAAQNQLRLTRRPTLAQRAKKYSGNLFQPLIARTQSLRKNVNSSVRRATGSGEAGARERAEDGKLHPFWHPRGFWEDVSDEDDEFGDDDDYHEQWEEVGDGEEGVLRLPLGGDTSDVPEPRRGVKGVIDGFRESGGFLIGNSLGLERGPTNRRRHYVDPGRMNANGGLQRSLEGRVQKKNSQGSLGRAVAQEQRKRRVWRGMGLHVEYLGIGGLREMMRERKAEKRREKLKRSIGERWTVEESPQL